MAEHGDDPVMRQARARYAEFEAAGTERLHRLLQESVTASTG